MLRLPRVLGAMASALTPIAALAQVGGIDWAEVDCAKSRIWPTAGLSCRTTAELTRDAFSTGPGHFRFWNAAGTVQDVKYYYYVAEAVNPNTGVVSKQELADALRLRSPQAKGSVQMSAIRQYKDADFVSFQSTAREACVGIRKVGPGNAQGTKWVLYATRCVPPGQQITEADIDSFIREARLRE
ncbi:MAG: hypothetical protein J0J01_13700 [Reyranella sp.]|uniref:hypothetical protein n=1 Tax=Reyranella sp. TaxID=1929291 RepID=UPI001ACC0968|nr:hypothetical protein [Reyranella sp.]MBN9087961.1 hypothetical protein [Reyranella sp.]